MASKYHGSEEEEWQVKDLCRFHGFEPGLPKRPIPYAKNRLVGKCHVWTPEDELLGCLSGVSSDCPGT